MHTLAIIGASLAGLSAARAARAHGFTGRLAMVGEEADRPYDRPPLSKEFLLGTVTESDLRLEGDDGLGVEWHLGSTAVSLDAAARTVVLDDGSCLAADGIVLATGAGARTIPGIATFTNVHTLRTVSDAVSLARELLPGRRMLIIGAGFIGAEVASSARTVGMQVTMVNAAPVPFAAALGEAMGEVLAGLHRDNGVDLVCGDTVARFHSSGGRVTGAQLASGRQVAADVVVVGIGAAPNIAWLAGSGIDLGDGVLCDELGRTSMPGIVAVGDCAAWLDPVSGCHRRTEHWAAALEQPGLAVGALLGAQARPEARKAPYFWSDQHGVKLQFAGCRDSADNIRIEAGDAAQRNLLAVYYRGAEPVAVLGMNQPRLFTRWRRMIASTAVADEPSPPVHAPAADCASGLPSQAPLAS